MRETGLGRTVATWVAEHGPKDIRALGQFLEPKLSQLTQPDGMIGRQEAAARLVRALREDERIVVFGDYDCDGITSAAILTQALRKTAELLGLDARRAKSRIQSLLANRFDGGYGVSSRAVDRVLELDPALLVTCDCGSSDHDSLHRIVNAGVEVVVIDHHLVPDKPLPALAFLNPHRPECGFEYKGLASCGLVLSVVAAIRRMLEGHLRGSLDVRQWLDLVAIGTIADVAPLDGDNRCLVRAGLKAVRRAERPGLRTLLERAKVSLDAPLTARDIGFRVAPFINAPGRLGSPDVALKLLLAESKEEAAALADKVYDINLERRGLQEDTVREAEEQIAANGYAERTAIVVGSDAWNPGIVGIAAGRIADKFNKPTIVIAFVGGVGRGSVRGPKGARLHDALSLVADVVERFGGHQAAAGLDVDVTRLDELRERFEQAVVDVHTDADVCHEDALLTVASSDAPATVLRDLERLEPCGERNRRPRLVLMASVLSAREVGGGHLKLELEVSGSDQPLSGFAVRMGELAESLAGAAVRCVGDLRYNTFAGRTRAEFFVEEVSTVSELSA